MPEIKCPHCGKVFAINEASYADILNQVRTHEFNAEVHEKLEQARQQSTSEWSLKVAELKNEAKQEAFEKEKQIMDLQHQIDRFAEEKTYLKQELELSLKEKLNQKELEITKVTASKNQELSDLKQELALQVNENLIEKRALQEKYESLIKEKDETIAIYKDFKARLSTKMVGESLEQHCETEFNRFRMTAFKNASFKKDNDVRSGSKGDYIYREFDEEGLEIISIMFEMKNEEETTASKKKNEHFFKELDKDRHDKNCEYAVLVSMLELDNELYNGITDVSYEYPKMYVIRPQFFIPIITLLRNAALNALQYKQEAELMRRQNIDITHFEQELDDFKTAFARNYDLASRKFKTAIEEIDKTITHLQKTKDALLSSENNLRLANNKAEDLSVKKLVRNNPTMKERFDALDDSEDDKTV